MEQDSKEKWSENHFGDSNPYEELPKMHIYTYNLGELLKTKYVEDKAFNFKEFFRTWTGNIKIDLKQMPKNANIGDFVHENDIISFLNLITKKIAKTTIHLLLKNIVIYLGILYGWYLG